MGACRDFSEKFVLLFSGLILVLSVVILGFSAYLINELGDEFKQLDLESPLLVSLVFAVLLFVFSAVGCVGAWKDIKVLQFVYLVACGGISLGVIIVGAVLLSQSDSVANVEDLKNVDGKIENNLIHFELAVFAACCGDAQSIEDQAAQDLLCTNTGDVQPCVTDEALFDDFIDFLDGSNSTTCQVLQDVKIDGQDVINENDIGNGDLCQDPEAFVEAVAQFIKEHMTQLAGANIGVGVVMLLLMLSTCVLLCTKDRESKKEEKKGKHHDDAVGPEHGH